MEGTSSDIYERRQPVARSASFSTIASSAAADQMKQFTYLSGNENTQNNQLGVVNNQTSIRLEGSEKIHVGDVIHYYYNDASEIPDQANGIIEERKNSGTDSSASDKFSESTKFFNGENRKRIILFTVLVLSVIVLISIIVPVTFFLLPDRQNNQSSTTSPSTTTTTYRPLPDFFVPRDQWNASPPKGGINNLSNPIKRVIVAHTAGNSCDSEENCKAIVKEIQSSNSHLDDIPYNFLIGGDERVYEGRGFDYEGQHTANLHGTEYNSIGICVAFIGNFSTTPPASSQLGVFQHFFEHFDYKFTRDFIIVLQDDLMYRNNRASALNEAISRLNNYYELQKVYRREEWGAIPPNGQHTKYSQKKEMALLSHTITGTCSSFSACASLMRNLQRGHMVNSGWIDYGFNFGIGEDGLIFESRGFDYVGAHMSGFNGRSIGIGAMGHFDNDEPSQGMLNALKKFLEDAAMLGKLPEDFKVHGRIDFGYSGPGNNIMKHIREWCRYGNRTTPC